MTAISELQKAVTQCVLSFWFFYCNFCFSKDVNDRKNPHKKAPQWRYLQKFLKVIQENRRIVILKMRQMFFSTFAIIYVLWILLFSQKPQQILIISETLAKAYNKGDDSLYGRLMYCYNHLPDYLKTSIIPSYQPQVILRNKVTNVTITFSANAPTAGRGSSFDLTIVDEYAWHDANTAKDLISSLTPMSYSLWVFSSPRGRNHFWKLIQDVIKGELEGFYFWDATKEQIDEEDTARREIYSELIRATPSHLRAREFSGSFDETQEGKTFPEFRPDLARQERKLTKEQIFELPKLGGMDYGMNPDSTALLLVVKIGEELHKFLSLELRNCLPSAFIGAVIQKLMLDYSMTELEARIVLADTAIYGDASGNNVSFTHDTTLIKEYRKYGLNLLKPSIRVSIRDGILAIHQIIDKNLFKELYCETEADNMVTVHITNCHYPMTNAGIITTIDKYDHDSLAFSSHVMDTLRYLCLNYLRRGNLQGFEQIPGEAKAESIAKSINPVFVGRVVGYNGVPIVDRGNDGTNLT